MRAVILGVFVLLASFFVSQVQAEELPGDRMLANYFRAETERLASECLQGIDSFDEWNRRRPLLRQQLLEMLGLSPEPERGDLHAKVTGTVVGPGFRVENLHYQSIPGLYVTGNLYLPEKREGKLPAILYVCGHSAVKKDNVSYGNKVAYQHHGAWFARHGYVCLVIDSLQLGEIEGMHHGLYRYDQWKWINYGYTAAGVEAWNCVRALDYLQSRAEVDPERLGVTGRSGGGAYSWWIAAIDDRIKAAVPVAGITDLEDHVVHGCVEGHCDCMYFSNTYGWDYATVAALVAPRPLLIANTDRDDIFPLDGVMRIHAKARHIYSLYNAPEALGVAITTGGHVDSQEIQVPTFRWFHHALKNGDESLIDEPTKAYFEPEQLRVFKELPADARNARIQDEFVQPAASLTVPTHRYEWKHKRARYLDAVKSKCFAAWPGDNPPLNMQFVGQWETKQEFGTPGAYRLQAYDFDSQPNIRLRLYCLEEISDDSPIGATIRVMDEPTWSEALAGLRVGFPDAFVGEELPAADPRAWNSEVVPWQGLHVNTRTVYCCPRGVGLSRWNGDPIVRRHIERRFVLLGQTLDSMRVYDIRRAIQAAQALPKNQRFTAGCGLSGTGVMGINALYAAMFEPGIDSLELNDVPATHDKGPYYLNVRRIWDIPEAIGTVSDNAAVRGDGDPAAFKLQKAFDSMRGEVELNR